MKLETRMEISQYLVLSSKIGQTQLSEGQENPFIKRLLKMTLKNPVCHTHIFFLYKLYILSHYTF